MWIVLPGAPREFAFHGGKDGFDRGAFSIWFCGKVFPHLEAYTRCPASGAALGLDHTLGLELLSAEGVAAFRIEFGVGQHAADRSTCIHLGNPSAKWYYGDPKDNTTLHTIGESAQLVDYTIEHINYGDKLMVGYRYWTTVGKRPLFPFGFGLSYTTFKFSNLHVPATAGRGATVPVSFDVTNTGKMQGAEVVQLYVSDPSAKVDRPERELKGFEKVRLAPGETKHVMLALDGRSFSYWDEAEHNWTIDPGKFVIRVGDSSEDTLLDSDQVLK